MKFFCKFLVNTPHWFRRNKPIMCANPENKRSAVNLLAPELLEK
jgi:hypothetical protein